jgi:hypothetical protein
MRCFPEAFPEMGRCSPLFALSLFAVERIYGIRGIITIHEASLISVCMSVRRPHKLIFVFLKAACCEAIGPWRLKYHQILFGIKFLDWLIFNVI